MTEQTTTDEVVNNAVSSDAAEAGAAKSAPPKRRSFGKNPRPAHQATVTAPSDLPRGHRQKLIGITTIAGGFLTLAGFLVTNWEGSDAGTLGYLDSLAATPEQSLIAATLLHFGYMGFLPMFLALAIMTRARWKIVGTIGAVAGLLAATGLPGALVTDFYDLAIRQTLSADQAVATSEAAQASPLAASFIIPSFWGLLVGVVVAGLAAWRARFMPWWPIVLMIAAFFFGAAPTVLGGSISGSGMMILMVAVGVQVLRMTGQEWATGIRVRR